MTALTATSTSTGDYQTTSTYNVTPLHYCTQVPCPICNPYFYQQPVYYPVPYPVYYGYVPTDPGKVVDETKELKKEIKKLKTEISKLRKELRGIKTGG